MAVLIIDDFSKISRNSLWFDDLDDVSELVVLIETSKTEDGFSQPSFDGLEQRAVDDLFKTPGCYLFDIEGWQLANIDNHPEVVSWSICRKGGPVNFTDDQIWSALVQYECEFRPMAPLLMGSRLEFRADDPIGYIEAMSSMERVLYKAVGYI